MEPFEFRHWHAWHGVGRRVLLSNECSKELRSFKDADACVNWLYLSDEKEAARALNAHVKVQP